jgi:acetyl-CoA acetyltransferase family protein
VVADAFICGGLRTPIGRFGGVLAGIRADDLAAIPLAALRERHPGADWGALDDVVLGCANQAGEDNRNVARMAALLAGLGDTVSGTTINRLCGSGLDAVAYAARAIRAGDASFTLAGGVESMTRATIGWRFDNSRMPSGVGTHSMPETAENIAQKWQISRIDQDAFAMRSQKRLANARRYGRLAAEIVRIEIPAKKGERVTVNQDEPPRATSLNTLAMLKPIVRPNGTVTAGNASGISDGAVALIIANETAAARQGFTPLARILGCATAGVAPRIMGIGAAPASAKLAARLGMAISDFDIIELNEAFAAQALAVLHEMGLPDDAAHVNPCGGAIALGHPLGMSGARLALTATLELQRRGAKRALCTMCVGVGQGIALAIERV